MTANASAALELHPKPPTIADAIREIGRVKAFGEILAEHERSVREVLQTAADAHDQETAWNHKLKGFGHAYMTEPELRPRVDADEFAQWAAERAPGRTATRRHVDAAKLDELLNGDRGDHLLGFLEELGVTVTERTYVDEDLAADTFDGATLVDTDNVDLTDGPCVDPETGEIIAGLTWHRAKPTLTVKIETGYKRELVTAARAALGAGDEAEVDAA